MKQLSRNFRMAGLMAAVLMTAAAEGATGGAAPKVPEAAAKAPTKAEQKKIDKAAADEKKAAEKKAKADAAAAKAAEKTVKDEQNGVTRPASGKTKTVWDVADAMSAELKAPVDRKALTDKLLAKPYELVVGTIHTQYGKWRKYHGLVTEKAAKPAAETPAADAAQA